MDQSEIESKQQQFVQMVGRLIFWAYDNGYELSFGEAYRTPEQAARDAQTNKGIFHSLHTLRLAVDFNLFVNGEYQWKSEMYQPLGEYWESIGGSWGGRFSKPDGNHFSLEHEGVR